MSNVSIFETRWINLVFEGRNKEYGAYQLRQENPKTTVKALLIATTLFCMLFASLKISSLFAKDPASDNRTICAFPLVMPPMTAPPSQKQPEEKSTFPPAKKEEPKKETNKKNLVDPTIVDRENANTDIATNTESETNPNQGSPEGTSAGNDGEGIEGGAEGGKGTESGSVGTGEEPKGPYVTASLDKMPAYPGGIESFYKYVAKNFKTPEMDTEKAVKVYVTFVIEKDGSMTDIRVPRNPGYGLDKEAIRVLKSLKIKWSPGMIGGKPVRTAYNLPINVQVK